MSALPQDPGPRTISQRELRNNSAQIIRDLEAGQSFVLTNNGRPVARVVPMEQPAYLPAVPRDPDARASDLKPVKASRPLQEILDELNADRP